MRVTERATLMASAGLALALALGACNPGTPTQEQANAVPENAFFPEQVATPVPMSTTSSAPRLAPAAASLRRGGGSIGYADWNDAPDSYGYIDEADNLFDMIGDAPPDYGFAYDDADPWAWQFDDGYAAYVEPIDDGYRYYYYAPGANEPFFVRDPQYSYAYRDGRVAAVYADGRLVRPDFARQQAATAAAYYARARALRAAATTTRNRQSVPAPVWAERRTAVVAPRQEWREARERLPEWRTYHAQRQEARQQDRDFVAERQARAAAAQRFATWQREGFRGATPQLYVPPKREARAVARIDPGNVVRRDHRGAEAARGEGRGPQRPGLTQIVPQSGPTADVKRAEAMRTAEAARVRAAQLQAAHATQVEAQAKRAQAQAAAKQAQAQARVVQLREQQRAKLRAVQVHDQGREQAKLRVEQQQRRAVEVRQQAHVERPAPHPRVVQQEAFRPHPAPQPHVVAPQPHAAVPPHPAPQPRVVVSQPPAHADHHGNNGKGREKHEPH